MEVDLLKKYLIATAAALLVALAVSLSGPEFVFGGEWLLMIMAPGGVWIWEDIVGD